MRSYVVGFLIDTQNETVLLIEKDHPNWQKGKLNGIGGKIKDLEFPIEAMIREFKEETGLGVTDWKKYCVLSGLTLENERFEVHFFYSFDAKNIDKAQKMETEEPHLAFIDEMSELNVISNLRWLIPMARSMPVSSAGIYKVKEM